MKTNVSFFWKFPGWGFSIVVVLIGLFSCQSSENNEIRYKEFPVTKELKSATIEVDTAIFRYPFRIRVKENKAIVMDLHNPDYYYHLFSYPDFTYLSSFGKRGEAPGEMISAENFRFKGNQEVWILDSNRSRMTRLGFSASGDSLLPIKEIPVDKALLRPLDLCMLGDSEIIVPDYSGESRYCVLDTLGTLLRKQGEIPTANTEALENAKPALAQAWRSFFDYNPGNKVLATVTQLGEVMEIYDYKKNTHLIIQGPNGEPEYQVMQGYAIPSGIMGYSDIQVTDKYIYAVFHGRTFKEMMQQHQQQQTVIDGGQYIYVFDLKGNPVCKYVLDRYIYGIHVDEAAGTIIATDINNDQPIVLFSMS